MSTNENENENENIFLPIPVQPCNGFFEDPNFAPARNSLSIPIQGHHWPQVMEHLNPANPGAPCVLENELDRIFFHNDRFELIVDSRGYSPEDIQCMVTEGAILVKASKVGTIQQPGGPLTQRTKSMERTYDLPQKINPGIGSCLLSKDGILVVSFPWCTEM